MTRRKLFSYLLLCLLLSGSANAMRPEDQAVTLANFLYVNYIATSQAKVYFATTSGVIVYNKLTNQWEEPLTGADGFVETDIRRIRVDRFDQHLYAEVASGWYEYNFTFKRWLTLFEQPTVESNDSHIAPPEELVAPFGYNYLGNGTMVDPEARSFTITDVVNDGDGNLWLGTWGYGVFRSGTIVNNLTPLPYGLVQNGAYSIYRDDSTLWTGGPTLTSSRTGVTGYNFIANSFSYIETGIHPDLPTVDINCVTGNKRSIILGTEAGLFIVDRANPSMIKRVDRRRGFADDNITSLQMVGEDTLFLGTTSGLLIYQIAGDSIRYIAQKQFFNRIIYDLAVTEGYLWIGSDVGAYRYSFESAKLQKFQDPDQVLFNRVFGIQAFGEAIWFVSDNGLVRLDLEDGTTTPYRVPSSRLDYRAIAVNDKIAAVTSERGVIFIFLEKEDLQTRDFSVEDGLASTYVYDLLFDGDYLWIGTDKGLTRFYWNNPNRID